MDSVDRAHHECFFALVVHGLSGHALGYVGWKLIWKPGTTDCYCWEGRRQIDIGEDLEKEEVRALILHEIAHIGTGTDHGNKHNHGFYAKLDELYEKFGDGVPVSGCDRVILEVYADLDTPFRKRL